MPRAHVLAAAVVAVATVSPALAAPPFQFYVVAERGQATPSGDGALGRFAFPSINNAGQVGFTSFLEGTSQATRNDYATFVAGPALGQLTEIGRERGTSPDGNGVPIGYYGVPINDVGQMAGLLDRTETASGDSDNYGVFRGGGGGSTILVAAENQPAPGNDGVFDDFEDIYVDALGRVTFRASVRNTSNGSGIFRGTGGTVTTIIRDGQPAPGGVVGNVGVVASGRINSIGQVAVRTSLTGTAGGAADDTAVYRTEGVNAVLVAREGDAAPGGNGVIGGLTLLSLHQDINGLGQVAFEAPLTGTSGGSADDRAIYRGSGPGTLAQMVRKGQAAPGGNGTFDSLSLPILDVFGRVAFLSSLAGTSGGDSDSYGFFLSDGTTISQIARSGQAAPDGNGVFSSVHDTAYNDLGQAVLLASITGTSGGQADDSAIYAYQPGLGLQLVIRKGESFLGSTVTDLAFNGDSIGPRGVGLSDTGQIAFAYELADGRAGIAVTLIPEPAGLLACSALFPLLGRRRRMV